MSLPVAPAGASIGLDLVSVPRFADRLASGGERLLARLFTAAERAACADRPRPAEHLAARFAAKEAAMKALGTGWSEGVAFTDFEVVSTPGRPPTLALQGRASEIAGRIGLRTWRVSLTHTADVAGAVVLALPD